MMTSVALLTHSMKATKVVDDCLVIAKKPVGVSKYRNDPGTVKESNLVAVVMPNSNPVRIDDPFNCRSPDLISTVQKSQE